LNASRLRPERDLADALTVYDKIVLPYFAGLDLRVIAQIAETETDAFRRFNRGLRQMLAALPDEPTPDDLTGIGEQLDEGTDRVAREAKRLATLRSLRNVEVGFFTTSIIAFMSHVDPAVTQLAGLVGSASLFDLVRSRIERRDAATSITKSDFYVPYLLGDWIRSTAAGGSVQVSDVVAGSSSTECGAERSADTGSCPALRTSAWWTRAARGSEGPLAGGLSGRRREAFCVGEAGG
jgi:hypothetical protein